MDKEREYLVIMPIGHVTFIEITPERESVIDNEYEGDVEEYLYDVLSEEFDFSVNNVNWTVLSESCITCYGTMPKITN